MKLRSAYLCLSQTAFLVACLFGLSYALSYLRFVRENSLLAWLPGVGIALLLAALVICYVGQMRPLRGKPITRRYFHLCLAAFVVACCFGMNFAMSYLRLVHHNDWTAWKPGVGIGLLLFSLILSYVGAVVAARRASQPSLPCV